MSLTMFDLCSLKCWRCDYKRCPVRIKKYELKLRASDAEPHMKYNLPWLEATLEDAKYQLVPDHPETQVVDWEQVTKALAFFKSDLTHTKRQLEEILSSDLMRQASTFMGAERAQGRWRGQLSVILEVLGFPEQDKETTKTILGEVVAEHKRFLKANQTETAKA